ncbi:MAG: TatD family hydrolase [Bacteroidales bacterium]|nr:TatD family hydrolase [Bacteroidales bacterium]
MNLVDTHTHLYLDAFDADRTITVQRAIDAGVKYMLLPNIDSTSIEPMLALHREFPHHCLPMMGLHPTSVKETWREELALVKSQLDQGGYCAVGEIGIDLYWDKSFRDAQEEVFRRQVGWAHEMNLPISLHSRESMNLILDILEEMALPGLRGVFHCFTGHIEQARRIEALEFHMGIGGVLTFKNAKVCQVLSQVSPDRLILETDAPFLAPAPHRGQRNEPAYLELVVTRLAECLNLSPQETAERTTAAATHLFALS